MAKLVSIRILMPIIAKLDLELFQMNVKTTFVYGELKESIYIEHAKCFIENNQENKVYQLKKISLQSQTIISPMVFHFSLSNTRN